MKLTTDGKPNMALRPENCALVIPTNRPDNFKAWLQAWRPLFPRGMTLIVVEDGVESEGIAELVRDVPNAHHLGWASAKAALGDEEWIISRRDSAIRSLGFLMAWDTHAIEWVVTLDDDCLPVDGSRNLFVQHAKHLSAPRWVESVPNTRTRGLPYFDLGQAEMPVHINQGGWRGIPDLDSVQTLSGPCTEIANWSSRVMPRGQFFPLCFTPEQLVVMSDGTTKEIAKISVGDMVVTSGNEVHKVLRTQHRDIDGEVVVAKISGRKTPIRATENHEILTTRGWTRAGDLIKGDFACVPILDERDDSIFSDKEAFMIGLFIAEGSFIKRSGMKDKRKLAGVSVALHRNEQDTLGKIAIEFFETKFKKPSQSYVVKNALRIECNSKDVAAWFHDQCGEYCDGKHLPPELVRARNVDQALAGLFAGDGHIGSNNSRPHCTYKTTSRKLADQIQYILGSLGYYCCLTLELSDGKKPAYQLSLYGDSASLFCGSILSSEINWQSKLPQAGRKWKSDGTNLWIKIDEVYREKYVGPVHNLTVEDNHTYLVNGCVVKNCGMNLAFRREAIPLMLFPMQGSDPNGNDWGFRRFDDIWAGVISKKVADHLGWSVSVGLPTIYHSRASDPMVNLVKEAPGISANEWFWRKIDAVKLTGTTPKDCIRELGSALIADEVPYVAKLGAALAIWSEQF